MRTAALKFLVSFALTISALQGCSMESWYAGGQQSAEAECRKKPGPESQRCMENLKKQRYEDYEKERKGS